MTFNSDYTAGRVGVAAIAVLASTLSWAGPVGDVQTDDVNRRLAATTMANPVPLLPFANPSQDQQKIYGKTYGEWAAAWVKWTESANLAPINDTTGASCGVAQPREGVWFLAGTFGVPDVSRACVIPPGRPLFYPLVELAWIDCPGTSDVDKSDAEVRASLAGAIDLAGELTTTLDGIQVPGLQISIVRAQSPTFTSVLPVNYAAANSCTPDLPAGRTGRQLVDGYWVILPPLSRGLHELTLHGSALDGDGQRFFENSVTYHLTVR